MQRTLTILLRARLARSLSTEAQSGQILNMFALMAVVAIGIIAIAVDVGFAYHQRQNHQNIATNAAEAGAYQVYGFTRYGTPTVTGGAAPSAAATADGEVLAAMVGVVQASGETAHATPPANGNACAASYAANEVYLQAEYLDAQNTPIPTPGGGPLMVGSGHYDPSARGVRVTALGGCAPAFFARVLGRQNFSVNAAEQAGLQATPHAGSSGGAPPDTPIPTVTGTISSAATGSPTSTLVPTLTATPTPTATPSVPGACTSNCSYTVANIPNFYPFGIWATPQPSAPYAMLFAQGAADAPANANQNLPSGSSTGDEVVPHDTQWTKAQYSGRTAGLSGTADGISASNDSFKGCLSLTQSFFNMDDWFDGVDKPGNGNACASDPSAGQTVVLPLIDSMQFSNGYWQYQVVGLVDVYVTDMTNGKGFEGVITGVYADPHQIVEVPPSPTTTPTSTVVPTSTFGPPLP